LVSQPRTRIVECRGGCPLGTLGAELAEIDDVARVVSDLPQQMPSAA
jgi:hypothetical protein